MKNSQQSFNLKARDNSRLKVENTQTFGNSSTTPKFMVNL